MEVFKRILGYRKILAGMMPGFLAVCRYLIKGPAGWSWSKRSSRRDPKSHSLTLILSDDAWKFLQSMQAQASSTGLTISIHLGSDVGFPLDMSAIKRGAPV